MDGIHDPNLYVFAVWEPVLTSDLFAPSTATLNRLHDRRVVQFWDKDRLLSKTMGEHDRKSVVWDRIAIYAPGKLWTNAPPEAAFMGGTVVRVLSQAEETLKRLLQPSASRSTIPALPAV